MRTFYTRQKQPLKQSNTIILILKAVTTDHMSVYIAKKIK